MVSLERSSRREFELEVSTLQAELNCFRFANETLTDTAAQAVKALGRAARLAGTATYTSLGWVRMGSSWEQAGVKQDAERIGPKEAGDASIGMICAACSEPIGMGDYTTLVPLGPGREAEARDAARRGLLYQAKAIEVHWDCATGGAEGN